VAVSYRRGRRTSDRTILDPVTLGPVTASTFVDAGALAVKDQADTADVVVNAITKEARYDSSAEVSMVSSGAMLTRTTLYSLTFTASGAEVAIDSNFYLRTQHDQDDYDLHVIVERLGTSGGTVDKFEAIMKCQAINGDGWFFGWQNISFTDTPPAGSVTYTVRVMHTFVIGSPGSFAAWKHRNRTMSAREFKR
jgi:hypothetical protein